MTMYKSGICLDYKVERKQGQQKPYQLFTRCTPGWNWVAGDRYYTEDQAVKRGEELQKEAEEAYLE